MSKPVSQSQLFDACRVLFPGALIQHEFVQQLHLHTLKKAYRKLAKEYHPDSCSDAADSSRSAEIFRRINGAYELLCGYLRLREHTAGSYRAQLRSTAPPHAATQEIRPKQQNTERIFRPRPQVTKHVRGPDDVYYEGPFPTYRLKFGLYLYYRGAIPYQAVVKALIWQRDMRPVIGQLAVAWGWLEPAFVSIVRSATEIPGTFGERAIKLGLLTEAQMGVLLLHQKMMQAHIGRYFVAKGYLTEWELSRYLREMNHFNKQVELTKNGKE